MESNLWNILQFHIKKKDNFVKTKKKNCQNNYLFESINNSSCDPRIGAPHGFVE